MLVVLPWYIIMLETEWYITYKVNVVLWNRKFKSMTLADSLSEVGSYLIHKLQYILYVLTQWRETTGFPRPSLRLQSYSGELHPMTSLAHKSLTMKCEHTGESTYDFGEESKYSA